MNLSNKKPYLNCLAQRKFTLFQLIHPVSLTIYGDIMMEKSSDIIYPEGTTVRFRIWQTNG